MDSMPASTNKKTDAALEKIVLAEVSLEDLRSLQRQDKETLARLRSELQGLRASRGKLILDATLAGSGPDAGEKADQVIEEKRLEIERLEDVLSARVPLVEAARRALAEAKAVYLQAAAEGLEAEADERQPKTDALLKKLEEWEGCKFVPQMPRKGDDPDSSLSRTLSLRSQARAFRETAAQLLREAPVGDNSEAGQPAFPLPEVVAARR